MSCGSRGICERFKSNNETRPASHQAGTIQAAFGCSALRALTLAVVGADYPNKRGPGRRFEIALCRPGDPVELIPEPKNPADENAIAVYSERDVQIGYLTAERAPLIGKYMRDGHDIVAVFQAPASFGAYVRVAFDGAAPVLPNQSGPDPAGDESDFCPDPVYDD